VQKRPSFSLILKALQISVATRGVAVAVKHITLSARISFANLDTSVNC
jgi:hypothetical protein